MTIREIKRVFIVLVLAISVSACGAGRVIETSDDSVDYRSAKSLPPLKKPELILGQATRPQVSEIVEPQEEVVAPLNLQVEELSEPAEVNIADTEVESVDIEQESEAYSEPDFEVLEYDEGTITLKESVEPDVVQEEVRVVEPDLESEQDLEVAPEPEQLDEVVTIDETTSIEEEQSASVVEVESASYISAAVVSNQNLSELEILADIDQAWEFVADNIQESNITVFSRNKAGLKFSIGCGDIPEQAEVIKSGGWSIFSRDTAAQSSYCSLALEERKGKIYASVLNRFGQKVVSEYSVPIYNRLLNN